MKARRHLFRAPAIFGTPLKYGAPVFIGFTVLVTGLNEADAGDILRGGSSSARPKPGANTLAGANTPDATDAARANAKDTLARTTRTLDALRAMQNSARNAAIASSANHLGSTPKNLTVNLPVVPNGLGLGGLNPTTDPTKWTGANTPIQTVKDGNTEVTIKQTTQQALLEWQTLNVGKKTTLTFDQSKGGADSSKWIAFNKITDPTGNPTQILGNIQADGQVYLINTNGIIFGGSSQVNARSLTASTLPINANLIQRGLLNNPDAQFLFSALPIPAGIDGTPAFTPDPITGEYGDVTVQEGAQLTSPTDATKTGGRITLVGANVTNNGTISTPDGQTILASGLQVGFAAHNTADASLRGLDVYVGTVGTYAGTTTNNGIIESDRSNITIAGKTVNQSGALTSTTSVALNGRIDIQSNYNAISNRATASARGDLFIFKDTGAVNLADNSAISILPEYESKETTIGTELALRSQISITSKTIHIGVNSTIHAPNALVDLKAGNWLFVDSSPPLSSFVQSGGQIYLEENALIDVSGSKDVSAPVSQNIVTVDLRGAELADSPLQRAGDLRGKSIQVDIRDTAIYQGKDWVGTPLANISGFANLIKRSVGQLTTAGGSVSMSAGSSVVMQKESNIDVSGGSVKFEGGMVRTSQLLTTDGRLVDISRATPDVVYKGIYDGTSTLTNAKFGVSEIYHAALSPGGYRYDPGSTEGAAGGTLAITSPSMALDGRFTGHTVTGENQRTSPPVASSLSLKFQAQEITYPTVPVYSPAAPLITFSSGIEQEAAKPFALDSNGNPLELDSDRKSRVVLSPALLKDSGFGNLTVDNHDGTILVPNDVKLAAPTGGSIAFRASNINVDGSVIAHSGSLSFSTYGISYDEINLLQLIPPTAPPVVQPGRGIFSLGSKGVLSTAGLVVDDRLNKGLPEVSPVLLKGGSIKIEGYSANLAAGGLLDVSGGALMSGTGTVSYGNGGSLTITAGRELGFSSTLGGTLNLAAKLQGLSGGKAGSLSITAPAIQIGGSTSNPNVTLINPEFFSRGGFGNFSIVGIGLTTSEPGVLIAQGTEISPVVNGWLGNVDENDDFGLKEITREEGVRSTANLSFGAVGATFAGGILAQGDVLMDGGSIIRTDALGSVSFSGQTITLLGDVLAAGGSISVKGPTSYPVNASDFPTRALPTVHLGGNSLLSTTGRVVLVDNVFGLRQGQVLAGGTISVSGNIVAEKGAVLDVSGTRGILDLPPANKTLEPSALNGLGGKKYVPVTLESDGGTITLPGSEMVFSDATLRGLAGGKSAIGGTLNVFSGKFVPATSTYTTADANLAVTQHGVSLPTPNTLVGVGIPVLDSAGNIAPQLGHLAVDGFENGGFNSLSLGGNVRFEGDVSISLPGSLRVADGGVIYSDANVSLTAGHVVLGQAFRSPSLQSPILFNRGIPGNLSPYFFGPSYGTGTLTVHADLIDIGNLSLAGIGNATLIAAKGDVRGNGTLQMAGDLIIHAGQIYPTTQSDFNIYAYDHSSGPGSVTILKGETRSLPFSAGGSLSIYASNIIQSGSLRAPIGTINLGWDGTGSAPLNPIAGSSVPAPVTTRLTLSSASVTSVSAIDPITQQAGILPYGISFDGSTWIDPAGNEITSAGAPEKQINLAAMDLRTEKGSSVDIRGGGDLFAYRWISGNGGSQDVLASEGSFAVIPGYGFDYAPFAPFNSDSSATKLQGQPGYTNSTLKVGDQITLAGSAGIPAGTYTLLPGRYALLPGAFLITPQTGSGVNASAQADGSSIVSGYRSNNLNQDRTGVTTIARFEVASSELVRQRSEYQILLANTVLKPAGNPTGAATFRLPIDSGYLSFTSSTSMSLNGGVSSAPGIIFNDKGKPIGTGLGSRIDINSSSDILINESGTGGSAGQLVLNVSQLNDFGAESLLIGGLRTPGANGSKITVNTDRLELDNEETPLEGTDIILVSNGEITLSEQSKITTNPNQTSVLDSLIFGNETIAGSGNGSLVRVSANASGGVSRYGVSGSSLANLNILADVKILGGSIVLDSTSATTLASSALLTAGDVSLSSGKISILLNNPGNLASNSGLVLAGNALSSLQSSAKRLSLLSYSTIDVYGNGTVGSRDFESLSLQAAAIRSVNTGTETVKFTAKNIILGNSANSTAGSPIAPGGPGSLNFDADNITLGVHAIHLDGFANSTLTASGKILFSGEGSLTASEDLTLVSPLLSGEGASKYRITAGDLLEVTRPTGATSPLKSSGFGADLTLEGARVAVNSDITLPSGTLTLHATSGNLTIGDAASATLNLAGTSTTFVDAIRYTSGGTVNLYSDAGSVTMAAAANINVSAQPGGGNAGTIRVKAPGGILSLAGNVTGAAGSKGDKGKFTLDIGSLAGSSLASLDGILNIGNFTSSRDYRIRNGDVNIDGAAKSHIYRVSADSGSIVVSNTVDASGKTGGTIDLKANGSLTLLDKVILNASGENFDSAGKGGSITLEAGNQRNGVSNSAAVLDLQAGSSINLSVATANATSESLGKFTGTLHLRAPRNAANNDLSANAIGSSITGASSILVEGVKLYDLTDYGGTISAAVQSWVQTDGQIFLGTAGTLSANEAAVTTRLLSSQSQSEKDKLSPILVLAPGAEMINTAIAANTQLNLNSAGSTLSVPAGGSILFPNGSSGNSIRSSVAATIVSANGQITSLEANTAAVIPAGSKLLFGNSGATVTYVAVSGSPGGAIVTSLVSGSTYTTGSTAATNSSATIAERGTVVTLNSASNTFANASSLALSAGTYITFPNGTVSNQVRSTAAGQIISRTGDITNFNANTNLSIPAGSFVTLNAPGSISYVSGTGGVSVALASGTFTTNRAVSVTPTTGDLTLGTTASTATSDWNLQAFRYGSKSAPGVLTLRAAGNLVFYNALSDGFAAVTPSASNGQSSLWLAPLMASNALLPTNTQTWSYHLTSGADLSSASYRSTLSKADLDLSATTLDKGSFLLGKNYGNAANLSTESSALSRTTISAISGRYQVIRTGSGDIEINSARNTYLLNQFATIYTAGTLLSQPTKVQTLGDFVIPYLTNATGGHPVQGSLGAIQQRYFVQYSMAGGNVSITAGGDIAHMTRDVNSATGGKLIDDSSRQLPNHWLYRRGSIDPATGASGAIGVGKAGGTGSQDLTDPDASTTWWVDYSNFFEGVGTLGGGNILLSAGNDVRNLDAVAPTNMRMAGGKPDSSKMVELGGGDIIVLAARNIDAGTYYVERGTGVLIAGNDITTNNTRSPSPGILQSLTNPDINLDPNTWLPTTLVIGKGGFDLQATGDLLLGPSVNTFLLPQGINNKFWYKTYFNTFANDSYVNAVSLGGTVTIRTDSTLSNSSTELPILSSWYLSQYDLSKSNRPANLQPWLRLAETKLDPFDTISSLMAPKLNVSSLDGSINIAGSITLYPSLNGQLELVAKDSIIGLQPTGLGSEGVQRWVASSINLSDTDPNSLPSITSPYSYFQVVGRTTSAQILTNDGLGAGFLDSISSRFHETGSTTGALQDEQQLHTPGGLHINDANPLRLYAANGNIEGIELFSPKKSKIIAGQDIGDVSLYIQNLSSGDVSVVSAGRDLVIYNPNTESRATANASIATNQAISLTPQAGDVQLSGPGNLQVFAGRNLDLGLGAGNPDGTGSGITSVGNGRNPYLDFKGANITVGAGIGPATSLTDSGLKWGAFIKDFVNTPDGLKLVAEVDPDLDFGALTPEQQTDVALQVFYLILRNAGRDHTARKSDADVTYTNGYAAIESLFGKGPWDGEILTQGRDIRTRSGGDIRIIAPGGGLTLANTTLGNPLTPPGIVTESGGKISIFTDKNVDIGIGRIFTLRGGDQVIWSTNGDIAAGSSSRTVSAAPPTRVIIDPQSGAVQTDLAGLATGGGIGALASVAGVKPANIDLIAPTGQIDAGDAGISATGNINVAAVTVVNAGNISAGGTSTGSPAAASAPSVSTVTSASNSTAASTSAATETAAKQSSQEVKATEGSLSIITVEVIGYGGSEDEEDKDKDKKAAEGNPAI